MSDFYKAPEANLEQAATSNEYGSVESALQGNYQFAIKEICAEAWQKVNGSKITFLMAAIIYVVVAIILEFGLATILTAFGLVTTDTLTPSGGAILGGTISELLQILITTPLMAGLIVMGMRIANGQVAEVGLMFSQFSKILPLFFTTILMWIFIAIGFVLLIVPGIYLLFAYAMAIPLVVDKDMGPWQALETSRKAITKKWFKYSGFYLLMLLAILLGVLLILIGVIWAAPFVLIAYGIAYRNIFGISKS